MQAGCGGVRRLHQPQGLQRVERGQSQLPGARTDGAGNTDPTPASYTWTVDIGSAVPDEPGVSIARSEEDQQDVLLTWLPVQKDKNGEFTWVINYQVFQSDQPYFDPDPTPVTGNLVKEPTDPDYLHKGVMNSLTNYFYVVRAVNMVGPSANSNRVGKFTYPLVPGQ